MNVYVLIHDVYYPYEGQDTTVVGVLPDLKSAKTFAKTWGATKWVRGKTSWTAPIHDSSYGGEVTAIIERHKVGRVSWS